jgi:hypothetical protein
MPDNQFLRDASERLTFELFRVPCSDYPAVCADVVAAFGLQLHTLPIAGLDQVFGAFRKGEQIVELAWDNWSGFIVTALNTEAEPLVREIGAFFESSPSWASVSK